MMLSDAVPEVVVDDAVLRDDYVFGDARHELLVVGTVQEGYRLWCSRCDRLGTLVHVSYADAQLSVAAARRDIAPACPERRRSA